MGRDLSTTLFPERPARRVPPGRPPLLTPLFPLPHLSPLLPVIYALFCVFLHTLKTQLFSFHTLPHSFTKIKRDRTSIKCFSRILNSLESASLKSRNQNETANC